MKTTILFFVIVFPLFAFGQQKDTAKLLDTIEVTSQVPFNKICHIRVFRKRSLKKNKWFNSTGFFIGKNYVLTAAHNIHSQGGTLVDSIEIVIGQHKDKALFEKIKIKGEDYCGKYSRTPEKYGFLKKREKRLPYDYGIIYIPDHLLPDKIEWEEEFHLGSILDSDSLNEVQIAGYPANKKAGYNGSLMISQKGRIQKRNSSKYSHWFETHGGNSGSPIWINRRGNRIVIGIHTFSGSGTLLNSKSILKINDWMNKEWR